MILIVFLAQCFQKISETEAVDLAAALVLVKTEIKWYRSNSESYVF
jgi:hypothetical protein